MEKKSERALSNGLQNVCIDLPGETVKCWRSTDKVQVVLRKHRDVIFDIRLASERKYTVESTGSDFYHADEKKLIAGKARQRVLFNDGERLHIWVSRDFKGEILLKSAEKLLPRLDPSKIDDREYDELPSSKPSPIVVSIGSSGKAQVKRQANIPPQPNKQLAFHPDSLGRPSAAPVEVNCPLVCVLEGSIKEAPAAVWKAIANGGGNTGLVDIDPFDVATRNWLWGQLAGAVAFVGDNWDWLKESLDGRTHKGFKLVSAKIHYVRNQARFYFAGYSKHNNVFRQGGYGSGHDRIMSIFGGTGKISTVVKSTAKGVAGLFKGNALISFVFGSATAFAEWKVDASKDGYDLFASILMSAIKAVVVAAIAAPIVAAILALIFFGAEAGVVVVAVGALCLGVGLIVSFGVDAADKGLGKAIGGEQNADGLSSIIANKIRQNVKGNWDYLQSKLLLKYEELPF